VRVTGSRAEGATATRFELKSREVTGNFEWNSAGGGKLTGRIGQFAIPDTAATPAMLQARTTEVIDRIPALDITVDQLSFKDRPLGTVRVAAENREGYWNTRVDVKNDDGMLEASGRWRRSTSQADTRVEFKLEAKNLDKLLARIGYPDTVRRGSASLAGNLSWNGTPFTIDYPSLAGNLKLEAAGGQFVKLEPGVGRLLGILSLQSLPRRITLDFRDVFSEGFAFDAIGGQFSVARGVMATERPADPRPLGQGADERQRQSRRRNPGPEGARATGGRRIDRGGHHDRQPGGRRRGLGGAETVQGPARPGLCLRVRRDRQLGRSERWKTEPDARQTRGGKQMKLAAVQMISSPDVAPNLATAKRA
jgi:hypothetical protein